MATGDFISRLRAGKWQFFVGLIRTVNLDYAMRPFVDTTGIAG